MRAEVLAVLFSASVWLSAGLMFMEKTPELALFKTGSSVPFFGFRSLRGSFAKDDDKLWRMELDCAISPFHSEKISYFAFEHSPGQFALFDAGCPDSPWEWHATATLRGLRQLMGANGTLTHVLLCAHF